MLPITVVIDVAEKTIIVPGSVYQSPGPVSKNKLIDIAQSALLEAIKRLDDQKDP